jgi:hypothetical protein
MDVMLCEPQLLSRNPELFEQEVLVRTSRKERRAIFDQHLVTEPDTLVADKDSRAGDDLLNITTTLATETATRFADS